MLNKVLINYTVSGCENFVCALLGLPQILLLHLLVSTNCPRQVLPPYIGAGLMQALLLD